MTEPHTHTHTFVWFLVVVFSNTGKLTCSQHKPKVSTVTFEQADMKKGKRADARYCRRFRRITGNLDSHLIMGFKTNALLIEIVVFSFVIIITVAKWRTRAAKWWFDAKRNMIWNWYFRHLCMIIICSFSLWFSRDTQMVMPWNKAKERKKQRQQQQKQ